MKKMKFDDLNKTIEQQRKNVNELIVKNRGEKRKKKSRVRSVGEREALNQISIMRWRKAVEKGDIKKIGPNKWFYNHTTVDNSPI